MVYATGRRPFQGLFATHELTVATVNSHCLKKTTVFACYTYDLHQQISIIFGKNASAPPDKTRKHENNILHSNVVLLLFQILTSRCLIFSSFIVMQLTFTLL